MLTNSRHGLMTDLYAGPDLFCHPQLRLPFVNASVTNDVLNIVSGPSSLMDDASVFYDTVHAWMPVISKAKFISDLSALTTQPRADTALLALCVSLIIQSPDSCNSENMRTSLYANAKTLVAFVESAGISSVRIVQSLLLISLYELGHGFANFAYSSICHTAAAAQNLGLHRLCSDKQASVENRAVTDVDEARRVWWGIVILDRYVFFPCR